MASPAIVRLPDLRRRCSLTAMSACLAGTAPLHRREDHLDLSTTNTTTVMKRRFENNRGAVKDCYDLHRAGYPAATRLFAAIFRQVPFKILAVWGNGWIVSGVVDA